MQTGAWHSLEILVRGVHALMVAAWLLFDFIVYWLHFKIKDATADTGERLERARIMHRIDTVVAYIFVLTLPVGLALCYLTDTPLFGPAWLSWKHLMYAVIIIAAVVLMPVSGSALRNLKQIQNGAKNVDALNAQIRRDMNFGMPFVFVIWGLLIVMSLMSVFNIKCPHCQNFIFR